MEKKLALNVENVKKTYQDKKNKAPVEALKGISFSVEPGKIFGLLGPNGAGKTTLIGGITTLETPTEGKIEVFGKDVCVEPLSTKMMVGVVHQEVINTGYFSVAEIMDFQSGYYGLYKNSERCEYLLNKLSLWEHRDKKVKQLSGGMKRRLMIAKALVHSPKLLLLDEPTAGVDVGLRETLWKFVQELQSSGITILLTTHYLEEAEQMCDEVAIINKGSLIFRGTPKHMIESYSHKKIRILLKDGRIVELVESAKIGISDCLIKHNLSLTDIVDIKIDEGRLEDAFSKMVAL